MTSRRSFLLSCASLAAVPAVARDFGPGAQPERYPDPDILAIDGSFGKYIQGNTPLRRLYTGCLWAEGPAWNGAGNYLVWSDIPNNAQMRYLPEDGHVSVMRSNSNNSNGNTFDTHGRQISAEHGARRVTRYELNGGITVLADKFEGKPFNAPNDVVVHPDGGVWFTDPGYGSMGDYEGNKGPLELKTAVYRIDPGGKVEKVTDVEDKPNGLCFSPDYKKLYVVDTGKGACINVYDVIDQKKLGEAKVFTAYKKANALTREVLDALRDDERSKVMQTVRSVQGGSHPSIASYRVEAELRKSLKQQGKDPNAILKSVDAPQHRGGSDGVRCDVDGNVWASAGWGGDGFDGVHVFNSEGQAIGQIRLPETGSNICFGGQKRNRLFITAGQSLYSIYVNTSGAHWC